jgi:small conductance mechanosensitive channel
MGDQLKMLDRMADKGADMAMTFGPKMLIAILILVAGHFVGGWAARATSRMLARFHLEPPVSALIERVVRLLVFGLFAIVALQNLGVELLPLIAGLSVAGAGIAFAAQGVLGNVVAGLTIIFTRPFRVGDYISIVKEEGEVLAVDLFSTTLGHADKSRIVIPNRKIVGEILHNYGRIRQLALEVGVAYGTDLAMAVRVVREVLEKNPRVLKDPAPGVAVGKLADSAVTIGVGPWVNVPDYGPASSEINQALVEAFRAKGIVIPFPQREVRMLA